MQGCGCLLVVYRRRGPTIPSDGSDVFVTESRFKSNQRELAEAWRMCEDQYDESFRGPIPKNLVLADVIEKYVCRRLRQERDDIVRIAARWRRVAGQLAGNEELSVEGVTMSTLREYDVPVEHMTLVSGNVSIHGHKPAGTVTIGLDGSEEFRMTVAEAILVVALVGDVLELMGHM